MKVQLQPYTFNHLNHKTYAENVEDYVWGGIAIYPQTIRKSSSIEVTGKLKDIVTYEEPIDENKYIQINQGSSIILGFKKNFNLDLSQIGEFSDIDPTTSADIYVTATGQFAGSKYELQFQHPVGLQYYVSYADHTPGTSMIGASIAVSIGSGFDIKLYLESEITIHNNSLIPGWIRIHDIFFRITNTVKSGIQSKRILRSLGQFEELYYSPSHPGNEYISLGGKVHVIMNQSTKDIKGWDGDNIFASGFGRVFDRWIDSVNGSARSNGYNESTSIIDCPPYIIESLLRDENYSERDLRITTVTDTTHIICNELLSSEDNYYNYSIYYNVTTGHKTYIADYNGSTKELTLASADASAASNDNIFLQNVRGDVKINYASFDLLGNTTNGVLKNWEFARSYNEKKNLYDMLNELCFESHCELIESIDPVTCEKQIKLIDLEKSYVDTWGNPAYINGIEQINGRLSPYEGVYTKFRLKYHYDYGSRDYKKEIYLDKNGFSENLTIIGATEQQLCEIAEKQYTCSRLIEFSSSNIYNDSTAEMFLQKKIEWLTRQHLIINFITPLIGDKDYIKFEKGDKIRLNFPQGVPELTTKNGYFIISNKSIVANVAGGYINWRLWQL